MMMDFGKIIYFAFMDANKHRFDNFTELLSDLLHQILVNNVTPEHELIRARDSAFEYFERGNSYQQSALSDMYENHIGIFKWYIQIIVNSWDGRNFVKICPIEFLSSQLQKQGINA